MDNAALLKDLGVQVKNLEDDLRSRTEPGEEFHAELRSEYDSARRARRTGATFGAWREDRLNQAAVAWVLATVFVRFCEDNDLIAAPWIAGTGDRLFDADERQQQFFREHPQKNDRDWLLAAFEHLAGTNEAVAGIFDKSHNPLWELQPSYGAATALLRFWRRLGIDGSLIYDFTDKETLDTRFLGDLYENLSPYARKVYALLQTPEFVEQFILDLTLEPAIKEFGLEPPWKHKPAGWPGDEPIVHGLRTIDPACGSGHFLLGIFHRLLDKWKAVDIPGLDDWGRIRKVLESIHGCDKNPFAAEIARFRLLIAALHATGETRLATAPSFPINVAVGDSLLHGRGARTPTQTLFGGGEQFTYVTEDVKKYAKSCDLLGINSYHVVVGNPPYITPKDKQENENYRRYSTASGAYALSVPFAQRIFELAIRAGGSDRAAGYTCQITANSFMKREFGRKLISWFHQQVDLTHVIDTSGAYIPGHGTPTVILVGRNRTAYKEAKVRGVLGVRGEPYQPDDAARGQVWTSIVERQAKPGSETNWVSVVDLERSALSAHPWSLGGGGASKILTEIERASQQKLLDVVAEIGAGAVTREDSAYMIGGGALRRARVDLQQRRPLVEGDAVRDYAIDDPTMALWPYDAETLKPRELLPIVRHLWPYRTSLRGRVAFGKTQLERGLSWFEYSMFFAGRYRSPLSITFAFVATHNHFVLNRGEKVFNRSAPAIKLPEGVGEDEHLKLLALLNSSTACFWLKQVSHDKGSQSGTGGFMHDEWERFYEFTGTKIQQFPIPATVPLGFGRNLDSLARSALAHDPGELVTSSTLSRNELDEARSNWLAIRNRMIALQEEIDWRIYGSYGLLEDAALEAATLKDSASIPEVCLGERAFEIVLARRVASEKEATVWFSRHGATPVTDIPEKWPTEYQRVVQARIELIEKLPKGVGLIERPEYKRRWAAVPWEKKEKVALRNWIFDRCEREDLWFGLRDGFRQPRTLTVNQLADQFKDDTDMRSAADLYASDHLGKRDLPLAKVLAEVIADEHVPYLAVLRYKPVGLRKRQAWEQIWKMQREEDESGTRLEIPVPPKYVTGDFQTFSYWSHRGRLDVPKERFISYPGVSPDADDTLLLGWAGWDYKDQAQALANLVNDRAEVGAWDAEKLTPLLAGLLEVLPWVKQWHGEEDPEWGGVPAVEFEAFLREQLGRYELAEQDLKSWRPPAKGRGRKKA